MENIILSEGELSRKMFNIKDGDIIIWSEYKMEDNWFFNEEFTITAAEFGMIFDAVFGK